MCFSFWFGPFAHSLIIYVFNNNYYNNLWGCNFAISFYTFLYECETIKSYTLYIKCERYTNINSFYDNINNNK